VRIGFYIRKKVVIHNRTYQNVPIPRWKCQQKGPLKCSHRTFSLLPHGLIPYHQHDLDTLFATLKFNCNAQHTLEDTKDFISEQGIAADIAIENSQIHDFQNIFSQSMMKVMAIPEFKRKIERNRYYRNTQPIQTLIHFIEHYRSLVEKIYLTPTSNIEKLAVDFFFHYQSGDYFQRDFLFGTPSQKR
jgi:hypothetical protein